MSNAFSPGPVSAQFGSADKSHENRSGTGEDRSASMKQEDPIAQSSSQAEQSPTPTQFLEEITSVERSAGCCRLVRDFRLYSGQD